MIDIILYLGYDNESTTLKTFIKELLPKKLGIPNMFLRITEVHVPEFEKEDLNTWGLPVADIYINNKYAGSIKMDDQLLMFNEYIIKFIKVLHDIVSGPISLA